MKKLLIALTAGLFAVTTTAQAENLTPEEQALVDKGATMETFAPNEHSRHQIVHIEGVRVRNGRRGTGSRRGAEYGGDALQPGASGAILVR